MVPQNSPPQPASLAEIRSRFKESYYPRAPEELLALRGSYSPRKGDADSLINEASGWIDRRKEGRATNPIYLGLVLGGEGFLQRLRQKGLFRLSRHDFRHDQVVGIVKALLRPGLGLGPEVLRYLRSIACLHEIAEDVATIYDGIVDCLRKEREVGLKVCVR